MAAGSKPNILIRRWRVLLGGFAAAASFVLARSAQLPPGLSVLIAWNGASVAYLATTGWMIWRDDEARVRRRASYEDEGHTLTTAILLSAVAASLGATVFALREGRSAYARAPIAPPWALAFSVSTLILGWLVVQAVFTIHYAHRYFGDGDADGKEDRGVQFPGAAPRNYTDFAYMAVCIGTSAQVSDFDITDNSFRRLVTFHSLLAFFFNTMVLALGINILASVIGG
ncbi:MAG TPA: DUF1345 domain-containing protein [Caulobacteraceae bacterium]|nr:DUF1345 domain-containing protein [Caulobacteraceae bacterium]